MKRVYKDGTVRYRKRMTWSGPPLAWAAPAFVGPTGSHGFGNEDCHMHRKDGPAWVQSDGLLMWHQFGQRYRKDGPVLVKPEGVDEARG